MKEMVCILTCYTDGAIEVRAENVTMPIGLLIKRQPRIFEMGVDSIAVLGVYLVGGYVFYSLRP